MAGYNFAALVIGPPEYGKTTIVRALVREHLETYKTGLALVHDPNMQFVGLCAAWEDARAWRAAVDASAGKPFPRGAAVGGEWEQLRDMAIEIGKRRNTALRVRVPILLACDESSLLEGSGRTHIAKPEIQLLSNRRHWGIGPVYNAQQATSLVDAFYALSTRVYALQQQSTKETEKLELRCGLKQGTLARLVDLPPYRYVEHHRGKGLV